MGVSQRGFGISGYDRFAEERLATTKKLSHIIKESKELLKSYRPVQPEVGVMFSPQSYYLN